MNEIVLMAENFIHIISTDEWQERISVERKVMIMKLSSGTTEAATTFRGMSHNSAGSKDNFKISHMNFERFRVGQTPKTMKNIWKLFLHQQSSAAYRLPLCMAFMHHGNYFLFILKLCSYTGT